MKVIQKVIGGLGNQMFQYAYVKALSLRKHTAFDIDISEYKRYFRPYELEIFDITKNYADNRNIPFYEHWNSPNKYINFLMIKGRDLLKSLNPKHHIEHQFNFDNRYNNITNGYIEGYFQSEKYFKDYEDDIKKDFTFIQAPSTVNKKLLAQVEKSNSISIHIRRGDYLKGNNINYHGVCSLEYYKQAINYMKEKVQNPQFYFFSDDIEWVKENIQSGLHNDVYINHNIGKESREDMRLMSHCKHNIIANSSFSRRGAWLNNHPNKIVIAPKKWFETDKLNYKDIIPDSWIKI